MKKTKFEKWLDKNPIRRHLIALTDGRIHGAVRKFAAKIKVRRQSIHLWMSGESLPKADNLGSVCAAIDIEMQDYLSWWHSRPKDVEKTDVRIDR